jgi:RNA polymerase sigma-70 factor (ECF subfamily)
MFFRRVGHGKETDLHGRSVADLSGRSPERELKKGEELRLVLRAMQQIPIDFQVALELYYWEEMPVTDIAEVLEVAEGTVKSRLWRGRELLRQEISSAPAEDALRESTLQALNEWIEALRDNVEGSDDE